MNYDDSSHSARSPYKTITLNERLKQVKDDFYRGLRENPDRKRESFELDIVEVKHFPNSKIVLTGVAFLKDQRRVLLKCEIDESSPAYDWWVAKNSGVSKASGGIDALKKNCRVSALAATSLALQDWSSLPRSHGCRFATGKTRYYP